VGRDSAIGKAIIYGLDGPGIESRWRRDIQHLSIPALGPTQPPVQWVQVKVKVKGHPRTGHDDPEGEYKYSFTLSLTSVLDGLGS
jgi:hypothetical protein